MLPCGTAVWRLNDSVLRDFDAMVALHMRAALGGIAVRVPALEARDVVGRPIGDVVRGLIARSRLRPAESSEVARVEADFSARMAEHLRVGVSVRETPGATAALIALRESRIHVSLRSELSQVVVDAAVRRLRWEDLLGEIVVDDRAAEPATAIPAPSNRA